MSDLNKGIARDYGVLLEDGVALRGLFLIDRDGIVRHALVNDLPLGRSVSEALRMLDALRFHELRGDVCPANWSEGDDGIAESQEGIVDYLSKYASDKDRLIRSVCEIRDSYPRFVRDGEKTRETVGSLGIPSQHRVTTNSFQRPSWMRAWTTRARSPTCAMRSDST